MGGLATTKTLNTKLTPKLVKECEKYIIFFHSELNTFLIQKGLNPISRIGFLGSTYYIDKDINENPDKEYGDIDYLFSINENITPESESFIFYKYKQAIVEFIKETDITYILKDDSIGLNGEKILFDIKGNIIQIDIMLCGKQFTFFYSKIFLPEYNHKGFIIQGFLSSLTEFLNISINTKGVVVKLDKNEKIIPYQNRKDVERIETISINPYTFLYDIYSWFCKYYHKSETLTLINLFGINPHYQTLDYLSKGVSNLIILLKNEDLLSDKYLPFEKILRIYRRKLNSQIENSKLNKIKKEQRDIYIYKIQKDIDYALKIVIKNFDMMIDDYR